MHRHLAPGAPGAPLLQAGRALMAAWALVAAAAAQAQTVPPPPAVAPATAGAPAQPTPATTPTATPSNAATPGSPAAAAAPAPAPAPAAQPIGYVKMVTGDVFITSGTQRVKAQPGTPVMAGSQVRTQPGASVGITCIDNTLLALGPDTAFTLDEYAYAPAQGKLGLLATLTRGTLNYVSGVIARLQPEAVKVKTPSGIIGVRGTEFAAKVEVEK